MELESIRIVVFGLRIRLKLSCTGAEIGGFTS
jgi:hypothetical protein